MIGEYSNNRMTDPAWRSSPKSPTRDHPRLCIAGPTFDAGADDFLDSPPATWSYEPAYKPSYVARDAHRRRCTERNTT